MSKTGHRLGFLYFVVSLCFIVAQSRVAAQIDSINYSRNAIYVEALGAGLLYSVNYDYRFSQHAGIRAGITHWTMPSLFGPGSTNLNAFPIQMYELTGNGAGHLELGLGILTVKKTYASNDFFFDNEEGNTLTVIGEATIGYRSQPLDGLLFRIAATPLFNLSGFLPYGGISLGHAF